MSATLNITDATFDTEVLKSDRLVVVDFWAAWCGPCKMIAPMLDEVASEMSAVVKVVKIDVDANSRVGATYGVMGLPTLLIFKNGQPVDSVVGAITESTMAFSCDGTYMPYLIEGISQLRLPLLSR